LLGGRVDGWRARSAEHLYYRSTAPNLLLPFRDGDTASFHAASLYHHRHHALLLRHTLHCHCAPLTTTARYILACPMGPPAVRWPPRHYHHHCRPTATTTALPTATPATAPRHAHGATAYHAAAARTTWQTNADLVLPWVFSPPLLHTLRRRFPAVADAALPATFKRRYRSAATIKAGLVCCNTCPFYRLFSTLPFALVLTVLQTYAYRRVPHSITSPHCDYHPTCWNRRQRARRLPFLTAAPTACSPLCATRSLPIPWFHVPRRYRDACLCITYLPLA